MQLLTDGLLGRNNHTYPSLMLKQESKFPRMAFDQSFQNGKHNCGPIMPLFVGAWIDTMTNKERLLCNHALICLRRPMPACQHLPNICQQRTCQVPTHLHHLGSSNNPKTLVTRWEGLKIGTRSVLCAHNHEMAIVGGNTTDILFGYVQIDMTGPICNLPGLWWVPILALSVRDGVYFSPLRPTDVLYSQTSQKRNWMQGWHNGKRADLLNWPIFRLKKYCGIVVPFPFNPALRVLFFALSCNRAWGRGREDQRNDCHAG